MLDVKIRFCTARDGVRIAYGIAGAGPPLVYPAVLLNNLELSPYMPGLRHWWEGMSSRHTLIWADLRGAGLSEREIPSTGVDEWVGDLEAMVDDLELETFAIFGDSAAAATGVTYAVRHPHRVSHLVLHGARASGPYREDPSEQQRTQFRSYLELMREWWGFQGPYAKNFFQDLIGFATPEVHRALDDLRTATMTADVAVRTMEAIFEMDVTELLPRVSTPTLVTHARRDHLVPPEYGRAIAAAIPGARLVLLDARNHLIQEDEPGWPVLLEELWRFLGVGGEGVTVSPPSNGTTLSAREREVLALIAAGKTNSEIAEALTIAPATASKHVHNILEKLGMTRRSEAAAWWASNGNGEG